MAEECNLSDKLCHYELNKVKRSNPEGLNEVNLEGV
jgi:hypothetical protein